MGCGSGNNYGDSYSGCTSCGGFEEPGVALRFRDGISCAAPEVQPPDDNCLPNLEEAQVALRFREPATAFESAVNARQFGGVAPPTLPKMTFLKRWAQSIESTLPMLPRMSALL